MKACFISLSCFAIQSWLNGREWSIPSEQISFRDGKSKWVSERPTTFMNMLAKIEMTPSDLHPSSSKRVKNLTIGLQIEFFFVTLRTCLFHKYAYSWINSLHGCKKGKGTFRLWLEALAFEEFWEKLDRQSLNMQGGAVVLVQDAYPPKPEVCI